MAFWLRTGALDIGVSDGVVRSDDFATLMQACEITNEAAQRLAKAGDEAATIVAQALQRAQQCLAEAQDESGRIRAQAYEQGMREAVERWAREMAEKAFDAHRSMQRASDRLAELVSLATQRVIEVEDKDGLYRRALRSVRQMADDSKTLVLHIGVDDADYARTVVSQLAQEIGIPVPLEVKVDSRLVSGGCVLESDYGVIDASMGLQIQAVKQAIGKAARAALGRMQDSEFVAGPAARAAAGEAAPPASRVDSDAA